MKSENRILLLILLLILPVFEVFSQEFSKQMPAEKVLPREFPKQTFDKGTELYSAGKYREAFDEWMSIYNLGYRSASLEYNIGNASFKINDIPDAILFYERALLLKPADENVLYNLQIAKTLVVDKFNEIPDLFFIRWYNFISLTIPTNGWARISLVSFVICLLFLSLYIYSSKYRFKVIGFWAAALLFIISVSSFSFSLRNKSLVYNSHKAIIFNPVINGKSSPDNSGTDLFVLHEGTKVTIEDEVGEWLEIRLPDGNKGWVPAKSLNKI
jgi:tetratricopeptide (TPR) repeat protein